MMYPGGRVIVNHGRCGEPNAVELHPRDQYFAVFISAFSVQHPRNPPANHLHPPSFLLHAIAGRRSQHAFTHATFAHLRDTFFATSSLPATTLARICAAAAPLAHSLFTIYYM